MNYNEEIYSLCDRIMAVCNRINKKLDVMDEQQPPTEAYGQQPYASFDSSVQQPRQPDYMEWQQLHTQQSLELRPPDPGLPYGAPQYSSAAYLPLTPYHQQGDQDWQPTLHPKAHPSNAPPESPPLPSPWPPLPYHHDYPQPPYTYTDSYVQPQYSYAEYHSWQHEYQPAQPPSQPLLPRSDHLLQPPHPQPPSCSHRRSATGHLPPVAASPNSTPTYTTSAIPPAAITQGRSCPEHPAVAAVLPPPQAAISSTCNPAVAAIPLPPQVAISSTCSPDRIDTLSPAPLPIVSPPQVVLSLPCSHEMINVAVQHRGKSSILDGEIESLVTNQGTIGRIASRNQPMITGVDRLKDINMWQVKIIVKDSCAFDPGGITREACYWRSSLLFSPTLFVAIASWFPP